MSHTDADCATADAVVAHHTQLAADLNRRVARVRAAARTGTGQTGTDPQWAGLRQDLLTWLRAELLPHAAAEEAALYPPAGRQEAGRRLVDGMVAEHRAIDGLVRELEAAPTAVDAAGAARAASALFVLIAAHAPIPLLAEIDRRFPGQIDAEWLQKGPDVWQIRLRRQLATA